MSYGPIEVLVVKFPGNQFTGELAPALASLIETGTIRLIDLIFAMKDSEGAVDIVELDELGEMTIASFDPLVSEVAGLLSDEDARHFADAIEPNSSAAVLLFENVWAARFAEGLRNAKGEVVLNERIPRAVIDELVAAAGADEPAKHEGART